MSIRVLHLRLAVLLLLPPAGNALLWGQAPQTETLESLVSTQSKAGEDKYWQALKVFREGKEADWPQGRKLLKESADLEFGHAQVYLGLCLQSGTYGHTKAPKKALQQFRLAAERGNGFALLNLGDAYFNGTGCSKNWDKAAEYYRAVLDAKTQFVIISPPPGMFSALQQDAGAGSLASSMPEADPADQARATACAGLGDILTKNKQLAQAQAFYLQAAGYGHASHYGATIKAAINYAFGTGVPKDKVRAEALLEQSRKMNKRMGAVYAHSLVEKKLVDDFAQGDLEDEIKKAGEKEQVQLFSNIAAVLSDKKSKSYDPKEAAKWLELAAEGGDAWAMLTLAFWHLEGKLGAPDEEKAFAYFEQASVKGRHYLGTANLAICLEQGIGTAPDKARAAALYAKDKDGDFICYLGSIGKAPARPLNYEAVVELNKTWAKDRKDAQAQFLWGVRCSKGWGVEASQKEAVKWFRKAAAQGHASALCSLGLLYEYNWELMKVANPQEGRQKAFEYYLKGAEAGDPYAMQNTAASYMNGEGVVRNLDKAEEWFQRCLKAKPDHHDAHANYGLLLRRRYDDAAKHAGVEVYDRLARQAKEAMLENFRIGAEGGNLWCQRNLALCYRDGLLPDEDHRNEYLYFEQAANQGDEFSRRQLGLMHEEGRGVPVTYQEAAYYYRLAALDGDIPSLRRLCNLYIEGRGVSQDSQRAAVWLSMLAERTREIPPLVALGGLMVQNGDYKDARSLYEAIDKLNKPIWSPLAQYRLGQLHARGLGGKADLQKAEKLRQQAFSSVTAKQLQEVAFAMRTEKQIPGAIDLLEMASDMGSQEACSSLAWAFITGEFTTRNTEKGWRMLRDLVSKNDRDAMLWMAYGTLKNLEGAPTLEEAIRLAEQAQALGQPKAPQVLAGLRKR